MDFQWKRGLLGVLVLVVFIVALYLTFGQENCQSFQCFQRNMASCLSAKYINEESDASWMYEVQGLRNGMCEIKVTLLNVKEGSLELRDYEGNFMFCAYSKGFVAYPEKDLDSCHGELKENLQAVIINKLYEYVVENLGIINEGLRRI